MATVAKIIERCPLKYKMIRALSSIQPSLISSSHSLAKQRMDVCLKMLLEINRITATTADLAKQQFGAFLNSHESASLKDFSVSEDRLDLVWFDLIGKDEKYSNLFAVVKQLLIVSRGNAAVESGFSVNEDMLVENLHEKSLIALRTVYDAVKFEGGISNIDINKDLIKSARLANSRYKDALAEQREKGETTEYERNKRKKLMNEMKQLQEKKRKLEESSATEKMLLDLKIAEIKKTL